MTKLERANMNFIVKISIQFLYLILYFFLAEDWSFISDEAKDLISKMLKYEAKDRISATEAYAHPWILSNVHVEPLDDKMMKKLG